MAAARLPNPTSGCQHDNSPIKRSSSTAANAAVGNQSVDGIVDSPVAESHKSESA